jgi:hypothetical protein
VESVKADLAYKKNILAFASSIHNKQQQKKNTPHVPLRQIAE